MRATACLLLCASLTTCGCASTRPALPSLIALPPIKSVPLAPPPSCLTPCPPLPRAAGQPDLETWITETLAAYGDCAFRQRECATELHRRASDQP